MKCFGRSLLGKVYREKTPTYIQACVGRRKVQLFHAVVEITRCIKVGLNFMLKISFSIYYYYNQLLL